MSIREDVARIQAEIVSICQNCRRSPDEITVVAVSKSRTVGEIQEVVSCGITNIGENRIQEAIGKYCGLREADCGMQNVKWHLIGHLQRNKVKPAVKIFDLIHSVDSLPLAREIDKQAKKINKVQDILIEVNVSLERTKYGVSEDEALDLARDVGQLNNLRLNGLMTIAPWVDNPDEARPYFRKLRELKDRINEIQNPKSLSDRQAGGIRNLSMGMTQDYKVAIEEGATILRIGRGIFGTTDEHR